jgi:hypothetical protein
LICASSSNATNVKNAAARLHWIMAFNTATTLRYVKIYNKASAPDPSTDTPVLRIPIPPNSSGISIPFPEPITLGTGLGFVIVTGQADNSTAVCTAGDVVLNLGYV